MCFVVVEFMENFIFQLIFEYVRVVFFYCLGMGQCGDFFGVVYYGKFFCGFKQVYFMYNGLLVDN